MQKPNQDIRDYLEDHSVTQRMLAKSMGLSDYKMCMMLKKELPEKEKEDIILHIDEIEKAALARQTAERGEEVDEAETEEETEQAEDVSVTTKFQIGDRVKIPSKQMTIGTVCDIWHSLVQDKMMYAVDIEGGGRGLYMENQLEPAPLPMEFTFTATSENNIAVVCMMATQGEKTWVYARGHAHILHDGAVGEAQAISYAAKRMFESLDTKTENRIYFKQEKGGAQ